MSRVEVVYLNATITTTREFVPVRTTKVTKTSTISADAVDQCIIKSPAIWPVQTPPPGEILNNPVEGDKKGILLQRSPKWVWEKLPLQLARKQK
jgi:hypothetical protein